MVTGTLDTAKQKSVSTGGVLTTMCQSAVLHLKTTITYLDPQSYHYYLSFIHCSRVENYEPFR
jgi:hypothetical protein